MCVAHPKGYACRLNPRLPQRRTLALFKDQLTHATRRLTSCSNLQAPMFDASSYVQLSHVRARTLTYGKELHVRTSSRQRVTHCVQHRACLLWLANPYARPMSVTHLFSCQDVYPCLVQLRVRSGELARLAFHDANLTSAGQVQVKRALSSPLPKTEPSL